MKIAATAVAAGLLSALMARPGALPAAAPPSATSSASTPVAQTPPASNSEVPATAAPATGVSAAGAPAGRAGRGDRGQISETFPAQQRPAGDPALIDRGRNLYSVTCSACHGADARGGQLGGPNLLRSQLVLNDQNGELILPVVQGGRPGTGMAPINMSADDVTAVAAFLHALEASSERQGVDEKGSLRRDPGADASVAGSLVSPTAGGTINWEPPAYSPDTGLFYVTERDGFSIFYLTDPDPRGSMGLGGKQEVAAGSVGSYLTAIDPKTGQIAWRHRYPGSGNGGGGGLLATAGRLVFGGDAAGNIVAYDALTGTPVWHARLGSVTNAPQTFLLDAHQY
jgi:mono/diheme cytochrome c family protein